jgi:hypothetical protein
MCAELKIVPTISGITGITQYDDKEVSRGLRLAHCTSFSLLLIWSLRAQNT